MSLSSSTKKAGIIVALISFDLVTQFTFGYMGFEWIWACIEYFGGYRTTWTGYWSDLIVVTDLRLIIWLCVWVGKYLLKKIHKEAMTEKLLDE